MLPARERLTKTLLPIANEQDDSGEEEEETGSTARKSPDRPRRSPERSAEDMIKCTRSKRYVIVTIIIIIITIIASPQVKQSRVK